jgi:hypothetical protein
VAVHGRDGNRVAEAEPVELECLGLAPGLVDLVRDQEDRLARAAEDRRQLFVARCDPRPRVDDEQHEVCLGDRAARLLDDLLRQRRGVGDVDPARVDEQEALARPLADDLFPVSGHAGCLVDHGLTRSRQAVDERRLADVREADNGDGAEEFLGAHGGGVA